MIDENKLPIELTFTIKRSKIVVKIVKIGFKITAYIEDEEVASCMCGRMELWLGLSMLYKKCSKIQTKLLSDAEIGTIKKIMEIDV